MDSKALYQGIPMFSMHVRNTVCFGKHGKAWVRGYGLLRDISADLSTFAAAYIAKVFLHELGYE